MIEEEIVAMAVAAIAEEIGIQIDRVRVVYFREMEDNSEES